MTSPSWSDLVKLADVAQIPSPAWAVVADADEVAATLAHLQLPVAVKALPEDAPHKSDLGLLELGLSDPGAVHDAVRRISSAVGGRPVLIQQMAPRSPVELLLSVMRDPDFGPILTLGWGGVLVEVLDDVAHVGWPADRDDVRAALDRLRVSAAMRDFRGQPDRDVEAVVDAALRLFAVVVADPGLTEVEINPLLVLAAGEGVLALDIAVTRSAPIASIGPG